MVMMKRYQGSDNLLILLYENSIPNDYFINGVVEKPSVKNAPSNKAVIGRYILPKTIFSKL